ncbi:MAG: O-antigen ligase family protein [Candidatus Brocadiia bacterium]
MTNVTWILCAACLVLAPFPALLALAAVALLGLTVVRALLKPTELRWDLVAALVLVNFAYWGLNALFVAGYWPHELLSWSFLRWQARGVLCYVPLLLLGLRAADVRLPLGKIVRAYVLISAAVAVLGLLQILVGVQPQIANDMQLSLWPVRWFQGEPWFFGFYRSHSAAGAGFAAAALGAWVLLLFREEEDPRVMLPAFVLLAWALMFTKSRTYVCAFLPTAFLSWLAAAVIRRRPIVRHLWVGAGFLLVLGLATFMVPRGPERFLSLPGISHRMFASAPEPQQQAGEGARTKPGDSADMGTVTAMNRRTYWDAALKMAKTHPVFGVGLGRYGREFYDMGYRTPWKPRLAMMHAHNSALHYLAELGAVGLLLQAALWGAILWAILRAAWNRLPDLNPTAVFTLFALALLVMNMAASLVGHVLWSPAAMLPTVAALTLALRRPADIAQARSP